MQENDKPVLIYSTFPSAEAAHAVGRVLVERGEAACVNIIDGMRSIYRWEGKIEEAGEAVMIIKTRKALAEKVMGSVKARHPYTNPALLIVPVDGGATDYLAWIAAETGSKDA